MIKKLSGLAASAACMLALCASASARDGIVGAAGSAAQGVVNAGEDIADGIFNAGTDIINGLENAADGDVEDLVEPDTSTPDTSKPDNGSPTLPLLPIKPDETDKDRPNGADKPDGDLAESEGDLGKPAAGNPATGLHMGYAASAAVLAAMGVTLSSIRRRDD